MSTPKKKEPKKQQNFNAKLAWITTTLDWIATHPQPTDEMKAWRKEYAVRVQCLRQQERYRHLELLA